MSNKYFRVVLKSQRKKKKTFVASNLSPAFLPSKLFLVVLMHHSLKIIVTGN